MGLDDVLFWCEAAVGLLLVPILLWQYSSFWRSLYRFAISYLGLIVILSVLYALIYAQLGTGFGVAYLFWHERFGTRVFASLGATLLLAVLGVIAYCLDPYPWATNEKTARWLRVDEHLKDEVAAWWSRRLTPIRAWAERAAGRVARLVTGRPDPGGPGRLPRPRPTPIDPPPGRLDKVKFGLNAVIDPIAVSPFQTWLEPKRANQIRLQRFLRTCRTPFLLLLMAPAFLPGFFARVPRVAPTVGLWDDSRVYDTGHPLGYLVGIVCWLTGIGLGVTFIKGLIRLSELPYAGRPARRGGAAAATAIQAVVWRPDWVHRDERCRWAAQGCPRPGCPRGEPEPGRQPPAGCRARRLFNVSIATFIVMFVAVYVAIGNVPALYRIATPAFAICALLGILAMAYALIAFLPRLVADFMPARLARILPREMVAYFPKAVQVPLVALLVVWLGFANNAPFKNRFENLLYDNAKLARFRSRVDQAYFDHKEPDRAPLVPDLTALEGWARGVRRGDGDVVDGRPKLVVVAVSGGAARSAYWTAVVLDRLERALPEFGRRVRIMAGASGGMLGTACYVAYRRDVARGDSAERQGAEGPRGQVPAQPSEWVRRVPRNSIEPLAKFIALSEVWQSLWPGPQGDDRGIVLERDWSDLRFPFTELAPLERDGRVPSLIFSPTIVEDGRRLLISNLDLYRDRNGAVRAVIPGVKSEGSEVSFNEPFDDRDYSLSGVEFYRIFPESCGLLLSTAVRMSASFPYVSPAVNLPTDPPRRVVDAGYYDNYGIQVASAWIRANRDWLAEHTSGVLLVQVRDSSSVRDRLDVDDTPPGYWDRAMRGFQFFTSPVDAFSRARYTVASFSNDDDVETLGAMFKEYMRGKVDDPEYFFATAIFENSALVVLRDDSVDTFWSDLRSIDKQDAAKVLGDGLGEVTMSWYLTPAELRATLRAIPDDPVADPHWLYAQNRADERNRLADRVFNTLPDDVMARLSPAQLEEERKNGRLSLPPGPERDLRLKRLEQLRNYERIVNLKEWWRSGRRITAKTAR
jgi:hypothetical protein